MDAEQKRRLTRYFLNSDIFLWGLGNDINDGQKEVYLWLFNEGFRRRSRNRSGLITSESVYKGLYHKVKQEMVDEYGIEKIINFVYRETLKQFGEDSINKLRNLWENPRKLLGVNLENVNTKITSKCGKDGKGSKQVSAGCSFFDLDSRYWSLRWSKFAAIFFEEVVPYIEAENKTTPKSQG